MLKKFKKTLAITLASVFVTGTAYIPSMAADDGASSYVIWEEDFEDYTGGKFTHPNLTRFSGTKVPKVDELGESRAFRTTNDSGHHIVYELDEDITSGAVWVSYDVSAGTTTTNTIYTGYEPTAYVGRGTDIKYRTVHTSYTPDGTVTHIATQNISSTSHSGAVSVSGNNWGSNDRVRIDWILDITNQTSDVYIDGVLLRSLTGVKLENGESGVPTVRGIHWNTSYEIVWDNIKIEYAPNSEFDFKVEEMEVAEDEIKVEFTQSISADSDVNEIAFKNLYTGKTVQPDSVEFKTRDELVFSVSGLSYSDEYEIVLPENFKNSYGEDFAASNPTFSVEDPNASFAVTGVEFSDYEENTYSLADGLTPIVKNITLSFTDDVDVDSLTDGISFVSKETGETAEIPVTFDTEGNKAIINFEGAFYENEEYDLKIDGVLSSGGDELSKSYAIPFSVGAGETTITAYAFYKEGVEITADDIEAGDEVSIKFSAVKPTRAAEDLYLSYGIYEDSLMTGFGIKKVEFAENSTGTITELNLIIPESENFTLKSFLWQKAGGFPLTTQIELVK